MGFAQPADEARARVGEREALATADVVQRVHRVPAGGIRVDRHECQRLDLLRRLEEHARAVAMAPLRRVCGPGAIAFGEQELLGVGRLIGLPFENRAR